MLQLKTFGGLSVEIDGVPATGAAQQRKTLALLALLAAAGRRGLSRDKLIASLWPETDTEHGRGLLKQACYALRRDLHAGDLFLGSIQLRLNPAVISSDVASFASAVEERDPAGQSRSTPRRSWTASIWPVAGSSAPGQRPSGRGWRVNAGPPWRRCRRRPPSAGSTGWR